MLIDIDNRIQDIVGMLYNVYTPCFYFYYNSDKFTPIDPQIRFECWFKQAPYKPDPFNKNEIPKQLPMVKIAGQYHLTEHELRDFDVWIALSKLQPMLNFLDVRIRGILDQVEKNAEGLKGYVFDREQTQIFNEYTRYVIHKKR